MSVVGMVNRYNYFFSRGAAYAKGAGEDKSLPDTVTTTAGETSAASSIVTPSEKMSPEVRSALNWIPAMLVANKRLQDADERSFGKLDIEDILGCFRAVQAHGGVMIEE